MTMPGKRLRLEITSRSVPSGSTMLIRWAVIASSSSSATPDLAASSRAFASAKDAAAYVARDSASNARIESASGTWLVMDRHVTGLAPTRSRHEDRPAEDAPLTLNASAPLALQVNPAKGSAPITDGSASMNVDTSQATTYAAPEHQPP